MSTGTTYNFCEFLWEKIAQKKFFDLKEGDLNENFNGTYDIFALTIFHNNLRGTEVFSSISSTWLKEPWIHIYSISLDS